MKNIKLNLAKLFSVRGVALVLVMSSALSMTGCGKKADCEVKGLHAHKYENTDGYIRYIDKEYLNYEGYERSDEYVQYDNKELMDFECKKDLLKIEDNLDIIANIQPQLQDFVEYRYAYTTYIPIRIGKITTFSPVTHYSWTRDANHSRLTGEQRLCHYVCNGYKIEMDEKGKYVLIPSENVDDIREVMEEYPYMKKDYYRAIDVMYGTDLDYENGPDKEAVNDDIQLEENNKEEGRKLTKSRS